MLNFHLSYRYLFFRPPPRGPTALPEGIVRLFAETPSGRIEILYAAPRGDSIDKHVSPLFFVHCGMGIAGCCAGFWLDRHLHELVEA